MSANELPVVAWMWQHSETGRVGFVDPWQVENGWQAANPRCLMTAELTNHAAASARIAALEEAHEQFRGDLAQALCDDCENGVKLLNEKAAADFARLYPRLHAALSKQEGTCT